MSEKHTFPVGVSVLITNSHGGVLVAKRKNNSGAGLLSTPGGRLEPNETLLQCAAREFLEETGATLKYPEIIGWREHFRFGNHYIMFYASGVVEGTISNLIPDKSEDWAFVDRRELTVDNCTEPQDLLDGLPNCDLCYEHCPKCGRHCTKGKMHSHKGYDGLAGMCWCQTCKQWWHREHKILAGGPIV